LQIQQTWSRYMESCEEWRQSGHYWTSLSKHSDSMHHYCSKAYIIDHADQNLLNKCKKTAPWS
jgi:hypothetical protein